MKITDIRHSGIVVNNLNKALHFYRDLLKMDIVIKKTLDSNFIVPLLNLKKKTKLTYVKLAPQGKKTPLFELLYFHSKKFKNYKTLQHVAFTVNCLNGLFLILSKHKVHFISVPVEDPEREHLLVFCRDFEGNLVELVQELKK